MSCRPGSTNGDRAFLISFPRSSPQRYRPGRLVRPTKKAPRLARVLRPHCLRGRHRAARCAHHRTAPAGKSSWNPPIASLRSLHGGNHVSPVGPFFGVLTAGRITAARNKFRSATKTWASALERTAEGLERACVEEDKADTLDRRRPRLPYRGDRHRRRELDRIAVHPGRDRREGDCAAAERRRELERAPVARREQLRLALAAASPHRADRVNDVAGAQAPRTRRLGVSGRTPAEEPALGEQRRARGAVDRAVHATPTEQAG